jgi:hypothetical protein
MAEDRPVRPSHPISRCTSTIWWRFARIDADRIPHDQIENVGTRSRRSFTGLPAGVVYPLGHQSGPATQAPGREYASPRLGVLNMLPMAFCKDALVELSLLSSNDGWVRGAQAMCEMYAATDTERFELILRRLSVGTTGLAVTEGARWLLERWQSRLAQVTHSGTSI